MKGINRKRRIVLILCFLYSAFSLSCYAFAEENGGAVQTNGEIAFFEEKTTQTSNEPTIQKPKGKLPATGEVVRNSLGGIGVLILLLLLFLFYRKRRNQKNE
ncbi:LPXTG cell wall anchor domain-containing protein [Enterococcus rivorum]|uniref:Gram-positive cocci surface proteins LPxTG domain-containing protein n=1 Tax=Enterococcus rivorum TaxID=762845 RepID=A0A1E5KX67_9ENTE|nr:LPXTG cell wall anchor domain-containing protein [Enterococcus rivorum]MBP2097261.1 LPXTG-motif cell wall-anchored protein [Enterococcus rivorum]OEH82457.1 hypothetical protein BCR26_02850 [Enterococcus rivorum]